MKPQILVTGAPGNVGTEVVRELKAKGVPFRVGVFNSGATPLKPDEKMEIVPFDYLNPDTFESAFTGIKHLFLVRPPALANVERDIAPAVRTAKAFGVEHIVFLSLQGVEKNRMVPHHKIERLILDSGFRYTFLRSSFFMQNLSTTHAAEIRHRGEIGLPVGKAKTSFIDVRDIAAVAVCALTDSRHENKKYTLTGKEALDYYQVADKLTAALKRSVRYTNPSLLHFIRRQVADGHKLGFTLVVAGLYTITRLGNAQEVTDDVEAILGRSPISFDQFVQEYRQCWQT